MITSNHIKYLKQELEPKEGYPHQELYEWSAQFLMSKPPNKTWNRFDWDKRYLTLSQSTQFFANLKFIDDLIHYVDSIDELLVHVDLMNIPIEALNFAVCYCYMCPTRMFSFDWRKLDAVEDARSIPPFTSSCEATSWHIYRSLYKDIYLKSLPILDVESFKSLHLTS